RVIRTRVAEVERVPELMQKRAVVRLSTVRAEDEIHFLRNAHRRTECARPLAGSVTSVERDPSSGTRVDSHLRAIAPDGAVHPRFRKCIVELAQSEQRERVRARRLSAGNAE